MAERREPHVLQRGDAIHPVVDVHPTNVDCSHSGGALRDQKRYVTSTYAYLVE